MMRVLCILVETTVPVRIRPRIETWPTNGHFLSVKRKMLAAVQAVFPRRVVAMRHGELEYQHSAPSSM